MTVKPVKTMAFLIGVLLLLGVFVVIRQVFFIVLAVKRGNYHQKPYERMLPDPELRFLFLGDSTAVGTGAKSAQGSTAGYFAEDFPNAQIVNQGKNGKRIHGLLTEFDRVPPGPYDLIVLQIGANDILRFTPYSDIGNNLAKLLRRAKEQSPHVVILHSGNIGAAPMLRWPFTFIMDVRSRHVRTIYIRQARKYGSVYVDLYSERKNDLFLTDVPRYYSPDELHPSEEGYRFWYQRIRESLNNANVRLENS